MSTFGPHSGKISNILCNQWSLVQQGFPKVEAFKFPPPPPLMSYKRDRNLRDTLVRSDIGPPKSERVQCTCNFPCLHCACCDNLIKGDSFSYLYTGKKDKISQRFSCSSSFVDHVISCPCGLLFVGKTTQEVKFRITKHKSTISKGLTDIPVPVHFLEKGHTISQLRYRVIDAILLLRRGGDTQQLLNKKRTILDFYS